MGFGVGDEVGDAYVSSSGIVGTEPKEREMATGSVGRDDMGEGGGRKNFVDSKSLNEGGSSTVPGGMTSVSYEGSILFLPIEDKPNEDRRDARALPPTDFFNGDIGGLFGEVACGFVLERAGVDNTWTAAAGVGVGGRSANIRSNCICRFSSRSLDLSSCYTVVRTNEGSP